MIEKIKKINPYVLTITLGFIGLLIITLFIGAIGFTMNAYTNGTMNPFKDQYVVSDKPEESIQQLYNSDDVSKQIEKEIQMIEKQMLANHSMNNSLNMPLIPNQLNRYNYISQINSNKNDKIVVEELNDKYVVTINMQEKAFNDNAIKINVEPRKIDIQLNETINKDHYRSSSSIIKTLAFSNPVDTSKVKRSNQGNKHIVTIPKL